MTKDHWPFRYDLSRIPYNYINRFSGLDLVDRVPELCTEFCNLVREEVTKAILKGETK